MNDTPKSQDRAEAADYYELCLLRARSELRMQVRALVGQCAQNSESNEAEATWIAAAEIESLVKNLVPKL